MPPKTRSATAAASSTVTDVQDPVKLCYIFVDEASPATRHDPVVIKLSRSQFGDMAQDCQDLFSAQLLQKLNFVAKNVASIKFWKPIKPILEDDVAYSLAKEVFNVLDRSLFSRVPPRKSFSSQLGDTIQNEDIVHLIVTAEGSYRPPRGLDRNDEAQDLHTPLPNILPERQRFNDICSLDFKSPSTNARSKDYASTQADPLRALYDGRIPEGVNVSTVAPPIQIYHPVFGKFIDLINDPTVTPSRKDLKEAQELMGLLSTIMTGHENYRNAPIRTRLTRILGKFLAPMSNTDTTAADGVISIVLRDSNIPLVIMELKKELGEGGSDATTQAGFSARAAFTQKDRKDIRDKCCCPVLLLAGGGPWLSVMGSVFTDKIIVQRLTDMMWLTCSSTEEDARVNRFARVLNALRICIHDLEVYYQEVATLPEPSTDPTTPLPRLYPYPTSFPAKDTVVEFEYVKAMEADSMCVTFEARTTNEAGSRDIVVKFVTRYGEDVHLFLAELGHAPNLLYLGPLPDHGSHLAQPIPPEMVTDGLFVGPMLMVVMDYVAPREGYPADAREQLQEVLKKLHNAGFVFGDLRNQNILFDEHDKVKLIDFDWAGRYERDPPAQPAAAGAAAGSTVKYVRYPLNISTKIPWAAGVEYLMHIRPQHDVDMLARLDFR